MLNRTTLIFSKGYLGFDAFFDGVGVGVNPRSINSIADGFIDLTNNGEYYLQNIRKLSNAGESKVFNSEFIGNKYVEAINEVI